MSSANIFDLVLLAVLVAVAFAYARRGFVAGLVQFIGNLASLVGAVVLSHQVAPIVFSQFFQSGFVNSIQDTISQEGVLGVEQTIEKYAGFLPEGVKDSLTESAAGLMNSTAPDLAAKLVDQVIAPLLTPIIAIVVFFVFFALCKILVSFVVAVLTNLNRIPVVGGVNRSMGLLMGLLAGTVDLYLVLCGVWAFIVITGGAVPYINSEALSGSITYSLFTQWNPFF